MQTPMIRAIATCDRLSRTEAETLARAVAIELGLKEAEAAATPLITADPEAERKMAWERIHDLIATHADATAITAAVRSRLQAHYNSDEIKQSWITLTGADPMSLVRTFCQLPYLPDGKTDPIARAVMESYANRLMHEKYADIYVKILKSLTNMFKVKPDGPTLVNFLNLLKWVDPEAEKKMAADIGVRANP